ncbi:cellulose binding domain-containing protein [Actinoplanes teichomyceticus]|uniref:Fibronectin type III domain protein n=1 Tax=Actinoplanes teichomyceticus TaxID=1867 RepID=Q70B13_ACTTI|nr:cellulose binding domain-containing protein [Actinoplanes teichomyceticus]TWG11285.1 fibronectin type III domain protein [Actinoplanes teichomyceticus]GIF16316.1 hypothetical protein Ate01nite_63480 [Actinoplanes teichomyceticus]CAE53336.1 putative glucanase [Actinoplanes teichomyceticus]
MPHRPRRIVTALVLTAALAVAGAVTGPVAHAGDRPATSTPTPPNPSPFPPTAPAGLTAAAVHATSVTLTWTASRPGCCVVDHYEVQYRLAFNDVVALVDAGNVTSTTITGLAPARQYSFQVTAVDGVNHRSAPSTVVTVVTPVSDTAPDTSPPSAPTGLAATEVTASRAVLTWAPSTDDVGVTGYDVYRFDGWYTSTLLTTTTATTYAVPTGGGRNVYYVRARDAAGNVSIASDTVSTVITTPSPSTPPPPEPVCRVGYRATSTWAGGFVAEVTVTNIGTEPIDGWTLTFAYGGDQRVSASWNGDVTQSGADVTVTGAAWNRRLGAGASATVGVLGSWRTSDAPPAAYTLNGRSCVTA